MAAQRAIFALGNTTDTGSLLQDKDFNETQKTTRSKFSVFLESLAKDGKFSIDSNVEIMNDYSKFILIPRDSGIDNRVREAIKLEYPNVKLNTQTNGREEIYLPFERVPMKTAKMMDHAVNLGILMSILLCYFILAWIDPSKYALFH